jgi:5-methylcytosine-specific restriction enzyme A
MKEVMTMSRVTGRKLNEHWGVGAAHALYHHRGTWYHLLERFPGALFDPNGYVLFRTREELESCPGFSGCGELYVANGIASLPGYIRVSRANEP